MDLNTYISSVGATDVTNFPCLFQDKDMFWDFITSRHETTYQVLILFSDLGTPDGYRHMHGYGSNTFKMVNASEHSVYVKFHYLVSLILYYLLSLLLSTETKVRKGLYNFPDL
jgi:hypothetical protein